MGRLHVSIEHLQSSLSAGDGQLQAMVPSIRVIDIGIGIMNQYYARVIVRHLLILHHLPGSLLSYRQKTDRAAVPGDIIFERVRDDRGAIEAVIPVDACLRFEEAAEVIESFPEGLWAAFSAPVGRGAAALTEFCTSHVVAWLGIGFEELGSILVLKRDAKMETLLTYIDNILLGLNLALGVNTSAYYLVFEACIVHIDMVPA